MINLFTDEHQELLAALIKHKVDFMLIGGYAVIHYKYDRNTGDMDIWIKTCELYQSRIVAGAGNSLQSPDRFKT